MKGLLYVGHLFVIVVAVFTGTAPNKNKPLKKACVILKDSTICTTNYYLKQDSSGITMLIYN